MVSVLNRRSLRGIQKIIYFKVVLRNIFIAFLLQGCCLVNAQLYDAQWVLSFDPSRIDFRNDTMINYTIPTFFTTDVTSANICDSSGNLLFITNGISIFDKDGNIISNGDSLSPCPYTDSKRIFGLNIQQAALFIPTPGHKDYYHLFHYSNDTLGMGRPGTLYYSLIDNTSGVGITVKKNIQFYRAAEFREGGLTACKHANGRDYWIVQAGRPDSVYYKFLLTPDSIFGPFVQYIDPQYTSPYDIAYSKFSQDGSKYVTACYEGYITVMDFDRCSGDFSNPLTIYNNASTHPATDPHTGSTSVEFSPSGRFVYAADKVNLTQYDLWSSNIQDSVEVYLAGTNDLAQLGSIQLAPNGKMYGSTWSGGYFFLHVINSPDEKGDTCDFQWGGYTTLTYDAVCLPNMINYKLGPLIGSTCDTVYAHLPTAINTESYATLRIIPNPADNYAYVEMGIQGDYEMQLLNENGQVLSTKQTRQVDIFDTEHLPAGLYFIHTRDRKTGKNYATQKLMVVH